jgi:acetyl esterase/lipase
MQNQDRTEGVTVGEHFVPWPDGISPEARAMLVAFHATDVTGGAPHPDPADFAAWEAFVEEVNAAILANSPLYNVAKRPGIRCETSEIGGVTVHVATPDAFPADRHGRVYLEMHAGGLVFLEGEGARRGAIREADRLGVRTIAIDFRVPPYFPYPAALDDCLAVYRALLDHYDPGDVILGGLSGGGNLAAALPLRIRDVGLALPAGVVLLTPEVDLTETGDSFDTLYGLDPIMRGRLSEQIRAYAPGRDLTHPYLSPIFADFSAGYPPTFLQSGTRDMFLSNTVRMHRALRKAGIRAELHVWEGMPHSGFLGAPEDDEISGEMRCFVGDIWGWERH